MGCFWRSLTLARPIFKAMSFFTLLASVAAFAASDKGGDTSGGGTLLIKSQGAKPILLDLALLKPDFVDSFTFGRPLSMPDTEFLKVVGFERARIKEDPAYSEAMRKLDEWRDASPVVVGLIREALVRMPLLYTEHRLKILPEYEMTAEQKESLSSKQLVAGAIYDVVFGARISRPIWNDLGDSSRVGLLIHEALRYVQLSSTGVGRKLSNGAIQEITGRLVLTRPKVGETFDNEKYLDANFLRRSKELGEQEKRNARLKKDACGTLGDANETLKRYRGKGLSEDMTCACTQPSSTVLTSSISTWMGQLQAVSRELSNYLFANWDKLNGGEREQLERLSWTAFNLASEANALSVSSSLTEVKNALGSISEVIQKAATKEELSLRRQVELGQSRIRSYLLNDTKGMTSAEKRQMKQIIESLRQYNKKLMNLGVLIGPED